MSLVGTRPILQDELRQYELHHRARIAIKPGITGMWQVSGRSDITDFEEVVRLDTEYISMLINTERRQTVHYRADRMAFRVLLCMDGCGTISYDEGTVNFYKGDCVFVPADSEVLTIHGQAQFLDIRG